MLTVWRLLLTACALMSATVIWAQDEDIDEPIILENYAADSETVLIELETLGLIPSGAEAAFIQNGLTFSGENAQFSNFAVDNETRTIVMGAVLNFTPESDDLEFCGIAARTQGAESNRLEDGSNITTIRLDAYAAAGIDNAGNIFVFEIDGDSSSALALAELDLDFTESVYLLVIIIDDSLTVFANGEVVISEYDLTLDAGSFAFLYAGMDEATSCQAETFFAYTIADDLVDSCRVSSDTVVNRRAGAGTDFARVDQLQADESLEAVGQTIGTDGFVWWYLDDETWVRDDVVDTSGFCRVLPEVD